MRTALVPAVLIVIASARAAAQPAAATATLDAQVLLDRAGFSTGEIDGRAGPNFGRAVDAFRRAHSVPETAAIDEVIAHLVRVVGEMPALVNYQIAPLDVEGPFTPHIPSDLMAQAKLDTLGYRTPVEKLGEKFHASPRLLQQLNPGARLMAGETILVPNVEPFDYSLPEPATLDAAEPVPPVTIVVTRATSALTVEDEDGRILFHAPVTTGSSHDPLPLGVWKVTGVQRNPVFHYNPELFWDAAPGHSKARLAAGPNNPVGVAWVDLTKEHYGIHGTPEPSRVGHAASHGCVRLTNWDVQRLLQWARPGTRVVFR
jgi:lipoprotein-anchoring transpeptidase ErfK/SrfK